jgi:hypothetical protein
LETYINDLNTIVTQITHLRTLIHNAEDLIYVRLDTLQNRLLFANTLILLLTAGNGFSQFLASSCGMNLDQKKIQNSFAYTFGFTFLSVILFYVAGWYYMVKTRMIPVESSLIIYYSFMYFQRVFKRCCKCCFENTLHNTGTTRYRQNLSASTAHRFSMLSSFHDHDL